MAAELCRAHRRVTAAMEPREERYWSRLAHAYDRDGEYIVGKPILQAIIERLSEEQDLGDAIDLGCGTGYLTKAITRHAQHVFATDLSDEMLEIARTQLSECRNVTVQKADCANTGFPDERFDSALLGNLVHVLDDPLPCLQESYRILRDGGALLIVDLTGHGLNPYRKARLGLRYLKRWGTPPRGGRHNLSTDELVWMVEGAGFAVKNVELLEAECNAIYLRGLKCAKPRFT